MFRSLKFADEEPDPCAYLLTCSCNGGSIEFFLKKLHRKRNKNLGSSKNKSTDMENVMLWFERLANMAALHRTITSSAVHVWSNVVFEGQPLYILKGGVLTFTVREINITFQPEVQYSGKTQKVNPF